MNKEYVLLLLLALVILSCKKEDKITGPSFTKVEVDTLLHDSISIRAIVIDGDKAWYAGSKGRYGWVPLTEGTGFVGIAANDTIFPEFRAIAQTDEDIFILHAGTPANLYRISKNGKYTEVVYTEEGEKVFYDSMQFFNDKEGLAMGDPTDGCLSVIKTIDGGHTWKKIDCSTLPKAVEGEAAFAASNTNIIIQGNKVWMVSGGKKSRVYSSDDKGDTWNVYETPIVQGSETKGIYGADFYDDRIGFAVGGDYTKPDDNSANKIVTDDGGKTWKRVAENKAFGYASCVQFMPGSKGHELLSVGPAGLYYSYDDGQNWKKIFDDNQLHTLKFVDAKTVIAAGNKKIIRLKLK
ncbi:WD40/YVTN/BNR-like repeat-containing protein [Flavobacterium rhizosphaerae]|uniref:Oxidoreductase n=1 Tax=Flavobacterium rhizosphaerae TaxID=3163298 RepID=A0ABW8YVQ4_9FLAO